MRAVPLSLLLLTPALAGCLNSVFNELTGTEPTDYLTDDQYSTWLIEVDYMTGHRPDTDSLALLESRLSEIARKDTIDIRIDDALSGSDRSWNINTLLDLKRQHQDFETGGDTVVTWVAYLDGNWHTDDNERRTLGVALSDYETIGILHNTLQSSDFLFVSEEDVENTVLVHEFGHIIGLVDNGIPMVNPHSDGGSHSDNRNSVMWAGVENALDYQLFNGDPPTTFDADDKRDICADGGKC